MSNVSPKAFWSAALCRNRSGKALVKMPTGKTSGQDSAVGRNLLAKLDPLSRGHPNRSATRQMIWSSSSFTLPSAYTTCHIL